MRKLLITGALVATSLGFASGMAPAGAATQRGLVNVNLEDVLVQVPVGLAANICDVDVAVLANALADGPATCTADADTDAIAIQDASNGQSTRQEGLVNLNVEDVKIQVPIAIAANVCDVDVAVLSGLLLDGPTTCEAAADSVAGG